MSPSPSPERLEADVVVIGMGPGGEDAAGRLAQAGLDVIGVEARLVGGECPYWGCVPSKMMIRAADALAEGRRIPDLAGRSTVEPDWSPVARRIREEATDNWDDRAAVDRFEGKGGRFVRGHGRLEGPGRVTVSAVSAGGGDAGSDGSGGHGGAGPGSGGGGVTHHIHVRRAVVINAGTAPSIPPVPGLDSVRYWTNREAIETEEVPESLIVLGGGTIGLELAQVFSRFGSDVTVVEADDRLLPMEEPEASELMAKVLTAEGIDVRTGARAENVADRDGSVVVTLAGGGQVTGRRLLVATGRKVDLGALGVESVGIDPAQRSIPVDARLRAAEGIWAVGDITGKGAFTHVSMYQAGIAVADILGREVHEADYKALPRVTFTDPEVGSVGMSEAAARKAGIDVRTGLTELAGSSRGWIHKVGNDGLIKLVEDAERGVLVGATSIGPSGGEVLGLLALAVHAAVPTARLRRMIFAYPTFHRAIESALGDLAGSGS